MPRPKRADGRNSTYAAIQRYAEDNYDRLSINVKKGERDLIKQYAYDNGYQGINALVNDLLAREIPEFDPIDGTPIWPISDKNRKNN